MNRLEIVLTLGLFIGTQLGAFFLVKATWKNPISNFLLRALGPRSRTRFGEVTARDVWLSAAAAGSVTAIEALVALWLGRLIASLPRLSPFTPLLSVLLVLAIGGAGLALWTTFRYAMKASDGDFGASGKFTITFRGIPIGTTEMEILQSPGLIIGGAFFPAPAFAEVAAELREVQDKFDHRRYKSPEGLVWDPSMRFTHPDHAKKVERLELGLIGPNGPVTLPGTLFVEDLTAPGGPDDLMVRLWSPEAEEWRAELRRLGADEVQPRQAFGHAIQEDRLRLGRVAKR